MKYIYYLSLGANLGDRLATIGKAIEDLLDSAGLECPLLMMDTEELKLPHPYMLERAFVMVPLAEIAPQLVLANGKRAVEICHSLPDRENIVSLPTD